MKVAMIGLGRMGEGMSPAVCSKQVSKYMDTAEKLFKSTRG